MITVNDAEISWRKGLTVEELLKDLKNEYPVIVKVNGKPIVKKQYDTFEVPDGAVVYTIDIIAGG